ncbi:hypothetical protein PanWU01x14_014130 [Parasponia andersonii]|uniref:Uncharacterized protein n=1 Tax=Parasponia andersonii TaxID=3476 RepID=A0A2P5E1B4_PARAD|nr:hypothetical protein PanWU01x14_014130 [Parasponia andersonii]
MAYPSLITELCSRARVVWKPSDEFILPQHVLNHPTLVRLLKHESVSYSSARASSTRQLPSASVPKSVVEPDDEADDSDSDLMMSRALCYND